MPIGAPNAGTATTGAAATSHNIPLPTTTNAGALLTLNWTQFTAGSTVTTPGGWTLREYIQGTAGATAGNVAVFWKFADGTEGGTNLTVSHSNSPAEAQIVEWSGVDPVTPFDVADSTLDDNASTNNTIILPALTTVTSATTVVYATSVNAQAQTAGALPGGFTQLSNGSGANCCMLSGYQQNMATGSTGTVTVTFSGTGKQVGILYALRPAVVAGGIGWEQVIRGPQPRTHAQGHGSLSYALTLAAAGSMHAHGQGRRRYPRTALAASGTGDQAERLARQWAELERLNVL